MRLLTKDEKKHVKAVERFMSTLVFIAWGLYFAALYDIINAKPQVETFFDRYFHTAVRKTWDFHLLRDAHIIIVVLCLFAFFGFLYNVVMHRQWGIKYRSSFILIFLLSILSLVLMALKNSQI